MRKFNLSAIVTSLAIILMPAISFAKEKEFNLEDYPGGGAALKIFGWIQDFVIPDTDLLWLWLITLPLTIIWMIWMRSETKEFFNKVGTVIIWGGLALVILLTFYSPIIWLVLKIFFKIMSVISFVSNPSWDGFTDLLWSIVMLIPLFFILKLIFWVKGKVPSEGNGYLSKILNYPKDLAMKAWGYRDKADKSPNWFYQAIGALLLASIINGNIVTNISSDVAVPGIIPGISAVLGIWFLLYRTVFGQRLVMRASGKPDKNGNIRCVNKHYVFNPDHTAIRITGIKGYVSIDKAKKLIAEGQKAELVTCGTIITPDDKTCPHFACNADNVTLLQSCDCGKTEIPADRVKCPSCSKPLSKRNPKPGPIFPEDDLTTKERMEEDGIRCSEGHHNPTGSLFCGDCGEKLSTDAEEEKGGKKSENYSDMDILLELLK